MRFVKFLGILMIVLATYGLSQAQSQPAESDVPPTERQALGSVQIFPHPAIDYVNVRMTNLKASDVKLTLHNIIGNEMSIETEIVDEHELRVKVKDLAPGYYLLAVKDDDTKFRRTYKVLKR